LDEAPNEVVYYRIDLVDKSSI